MNVNGTVNFTTPTKQITQCQVGFNCFIINLNHTQKNFDGFIWLFIQKVIQATKVLRRLALKHTAGNAKDPTFSARQPTCCGGYSTGNRISKNSNTKTLHKY